MPTPTCWPRPTSRCTKRSGQARTGSASRQPAIDDFGTGYSSLSYLKRFPVDIVKIDGSFVDDGLGDSPVDREIVAAVIRLAAAVGMQTVAEGVETPAQLEQLRRLGCSLVQGYLLAAPQPLADLERALASAALAVPSPRSAGIGSLG
jgi:EAL domain-containing protein (putative c-di-GMP-specific phosphodiesterase class I)